MTSPLRYASKYIDKLVPAVLHTPMEIKDLTLNDSDSTVSNARHAERNLFEHYGIVAKDHYILLKSYGIKIRVSEIGDGEPLIVVPGNTGDVFPLTPLLAEIKGRRIIAINRPGGGLSEGMDHTQVNIRQFAFEVLDTVMETFGLKSADIMAHSMGAHWSLWLAMDKPERVRSLSLLGNPGNVMTGKPPLLLRLLFKWPFNKLFFKILQGKDGDTRPTMLKQMGSTDETIESLPKEIGEAYYYFRRLPHYFISLTSLFQNAPANIDAGQLITVRQPSQLILGDRDTFASVETGKHIADAMLNCKLQVVKGASHLPWLENAEECGELINKFLQQQA